MEKLLRELLESFFHKTMTFLDVLAGLVLLWFAFRGYKKGLISEIGFVIGLIGAIIISMSWYITLSELISQWLPIHGYTLISIAFLILFFPLLFLFKSIFKIIEFSISTAGLSHLNQWLGITTGLIKGVLIIAMVIWSFELFNNTSWIRAVESKFRYTGKLSELRKNICLHLGWDDPVKKGTEFIENWFSQKNLGEEL